MAKEVEENKEIKKQAAEQAPPPSFIREVIRQNKEKQGVEPGLNAEKVMLEFSESDAWKLLLDFINRKQALLAQGVREASGGSVSMEEVGFKYLVADQVNTFASQIIDFVERPARGRKAENERRADRNNS